MRKTTRSSGKTVSAKPATEWARFGVSGIHGSGGFALERIPEGTRIIEYVGEKISKAVSADRCRSNNHYIFTFNKRFDLDGNFEWNPARLLNHSCQPNCEAQWQNGRIWIVALREIAPDEELTFDYGYEYEGYQEHPCRCGAPDCLGFIVAAEYANDLRARAKA